MAKLLFDVLLGLFGLALIYGCGFIHGVITARFWTRKLFEKATRLFK